MLAIALALLIFQSEPSSETVRLDFPDAVELKVLVDYVATTLRLNLLYEDEALQSKKIALRVTQPVAKDTLLPLLRTVLRSRGLALVAGEQPGWLKVVAGEKLASEGGALLRDLPSEGSDADFVTFVLPVRFGDLQRIQTAITPLLSKPGGSLLAVGESQALVITDFARNVRRAVEIAALLDVESAGTQIESIPVKHQEPAELAVFVTKLLVEREKALAPTQLPVAAAPPLTLQVDPIAGGLIAIGPADLILRARELVQRFDQPVSRRTDVYRPRFVTAARLRPLLEQWLGTAGARLAADDAGNMLIVTARPEEHERIRELLDRFDASPPESVAPLRFYKLMNRRADDVFATLGALLGGTAESAEVLEGGATSQPVRPVAARARSSIGSSASADAYRQNGATRRTAADSGGDPLQHENGAGRAADAASIRGENYSLSVDTHTNTIVAIAPPELHRQIEQLITQLDKRRPQVLVEVTLVSIAVDDSLNLGVELETLDLGDPWDYLLFTSFGLSQITPTDGRRRMTPLPGGSGALIAPDEVPIIINALAGNGNTRIYSAPRILVDDNATGRIESVAESPFTSVNASNTVATTSFAGFAKAGTQLSIEPHIAEGDHLEIKYDLSVSSFTGAGTGTAPPPRSSDTMSSTVRVPDSYTVVVGGLMTETLGESASQVPLIGDVPGIGFLFGNRTRSKSKVRLYAFIRPTVLRNDGFEDLKYLSSEALKAAEVPDGFPPDRLQYMR